MICLIVILSTGCSKPEPVQGVPAFCAAILPLLHTYSDQERREISSLMGARPVLRKPVETAVGVRQLADAHC